VKVMNGRRILGLVLLAVWVLFGPMAIAFWRLRSGGELPHGLHSHSLSSAGAGHDSRSGSRPGTRT